MVCMLLSVIGCNKKEVCIEEIPYIAYDLDVFFDDLVRSYQDDGQSNAALVKYVADASEIEQMTVPVLKSTEYKFRCVEIRDFGYMYYYVPADAKETRYFDSDTGITIIIMKSEKSFEAQVKQEGLTVVDGLAYNSEKNTWHINNDGKRTTIKFPKTETIDTSDLLYEFFGFKEYSVSADGMSEINN